MAKNYQQKVLFVTMRKLAKMIQFYCKHRGMVCPAIGKVFCFMKRYEKMGALICCASNGVMNVDSIKKLVDYLSAMGYNLLELVIDDIYKLNDEPYFGYLRGGYTKEEIREMDEYARSKEIELVPCIQTLAHLTNLVKLPEYADIVDIDDILLVDEPRTYQLIDKMFASIADSFSTRTVNIGYDEAHRIGRGKYFDKHGCCDRYELLLRHLNKVVEIATKYGFSIHMWSDMFFRIANNGEYYGKDVVIPQSVIDDIPDVELCYWDYYSETPDMYEAMLTSHEKFGKKLWFAGGAWTCNGFAPMSKLALRNLKVAFEQVNKHNVDNYLITIWGDNGHDCSYFSAIATLYAAKQYAEGNFDEQLIRQGFYDLFGVSFDDFLTLDLPNKSDENSELLLQRGQCKSLLFNDPFLGWKDYALSQVGHIPFGDYARQLRDTAKRMKQFAPLYYNLANLCDVLEVKADLGLDTRRAYQSDDKKALHKLIAKYEKSAKLIKKFRNSLYSIWMQDNKPYGWEVHEIRLAGVQARLIDCADRLRKYVHGKLNEIPELKETILPWGNLDCNVYKRLVSVSEL